MRKSLRLLLVAAALNVLMGAGVALAQTVIVRQAPAAQPIELMLNATKVATATADAAGDATLPLDLRANNGGKTDIDANVFVDTCDTLRRVIVVERGQPIATQEAGCERRDIAGLYAVTRLNTLVVNLGGPNPTMMLVKGKYSLTPQIAWGPPAGLVLFGGGGFTSFRDAALIFCGTATDCGKNESIGYTAGGTLWIKRWLGVEGGYMKPRKVTATGSGDTYTFDSELDVDMATVAGVVGVPIGPVRLFGKGGANFHYGKSTTNNTINGATQSFVFETQGWGWLVGGGLEVWAKPTFAIYADAGFAALRGNPNGGGEARFEDRLRYVVAGARVRIGR